MHALPRVREIHERFPEILTVIGVHSGKFRAERRTDRIATARERLGVDHPVVNDRHFRVWRSYAVSAWPTIALIGPEGRLLATIPGEFDVGPLAEEIGRLAAAYGEAGMLRPGPDPFERIPLPRVPGILRFPARVLMAGGRLLISDAGHHRVLEAEARREAGRLIARVTRQWGDGTPGLTDGDAAAARFAEPQGLTLLGDSAFVADRADHAVRRLDLARGEVTTIAGTGELAAYRIAEGDAAIPLRSPWALLPRDAGLLVSMAGSHQLFGLEPSPPGWTLRLIAGSGAEDIRDGTALSAELAQPTGLASSPGGTLVADCESSAVRLLGGGAVGTLVGTGLFDFGDRDGTSDEALLQHAEDVTWHGGEAIVADTYNDKLKAIDPSSGRTRTLPGEAGGGLHGPRGVVSLGDSLLVTDTDAHRIVEVSPSGRLEEVRIEW